jgi:hypothetical protein
VRTHEAFRIDFDIPSPALLLVCAFTMIALLLLGAAQGRLHELENNPHEEDVEPLSLVDENQKHRELNAKCNNGTDPNYLDSWRCIAYKAPIWLGGDQPGRYLHLVNTTGCFESKTMNTKINDILGCRLGCKPYNGCCPTFCVDDLVAKGWVCGKCP